MARDARWPFLPVLIVRSVQALFAVIVLGTAGYLTGQWTPAVWWAAFGLVTALFTLIYVAINFVLLFMGLLLPLAVVIVDAFLLLFWIISLSGAGADGFVGSDCTYTGGDYGFYDYDIYTYTSTPCVVGKAMFAMELLSMFLFIGSLAYASLILHKNRKDLRGKKYRASGLNPEAGNNAVAMIPQGNFDGTAEQKQEYYATTTGTPAPTQTPVYGAEQQQPYYTGQGQTPAPYVQGPPAQFVSPPASPPPGQIPMQSTGYSTGGTSELGATAHDPNYPPPPNRNELPSG